MKVSAIKNLVFARKKMVEAAMAVMMLALVYFMAGKAADMKVAAEVEKAAACTVVIDPGHGGVDGGAVSVTGYAEKDVNLSIALKLKEKLEAAGITVIMTRDKDEGLYNSDDSNKKVADMRARCQIVNDANPNLLVSIHQNNYQSEGVKGAQVFYYTHSIEGKKLAELLQSALIQGLDPDNGRAAKANDNYYILKNVECPAVIAECGFLSNYQEAELLSTDAYQDKVAEALKSGICQYLGLDTE